MGKETVPSTYRTREYEALTRDVSYDLEKFKDPYVVGAMIHRLVDERKLTNQLFRQLNDKLDILIAQKSPTPPSKTVLLSDVDERILGFVKKQKKVCARDVKKLLHYKGENAASARLNSLHRQGLIQKSRAGKKVYFHM